MCLCCNWDECKALTTLQLFSGAADSIHPVQPSLCTVSAVTVQVLAAAAAAVCAC